MTTHGYLLSITTSKTDTGIALAIRNTAGRAQAFHGFSNGGVTTNLWIISEARKSKEEVITLLQVIPAIQNISIVSLSIPVYTNELAEVRELFAHIGWDSSNVTDDALWLFINAKLKGQYNYYIDYDYKEKGPVKIQVKPIEQHPHFSPDWLKPTMHIDDKYHTREMTMEDIEIQSFVFKEVEGDEPLPTEHL